MSTYEEAIAAKEKFKEEYWKKAPSKYNAIAIGIDILFTLVEEEITNEVEDYFVKAYLFDLNDKEGLPPTIDGVEIKYISVIEKEENP